MTGYTKNSVLNAVHVEDPYNRSDDFYRRILMHICLSADGLVELLAKGPNNNASG